MVRAWKNRLLTLVVLLVILPLLALLLSGGFGGVNDPGLEQPIQHVSTAASRPDRLDTDTPNPHNNLYFGDLHIHTSYSTDAYVMGVRTLPSDAYRYAMGEEIMHGAGYPIKAARPLDFAAVTDHAEYLGMMRGNPADLPLEKRGLKDILQNDNRLSITLAYLETTLHIARNYFKPPVVDEQLANAAWQQTIASAERFYRPGQFTTFIGYEWSSQPGGSNLHRNLLYRGGAGDVPDVPFSALDSEDPLQLLREVERQNSAGMSVMAIPHNGNLSNGRMYTKLDFNGQPMSADLARLRRQYEPLSEIFQVKGSSATHPALSTEDEFADFEIFESNMTAFGEVAPPTGGYAREALKTGLEMAWENGTNPYKFGVIGASDSHNSSSPVDEDSFHGKLPMMDGAASLRLNEALLLPDSLNRARRWGSGGLAGVWAPENTREALYDAMLRKETFATSGPRIRVRFFAGWRFDESLFDHSDWLSTAYQAGVAMGAELPTVAHAPHQAPGFLIWAAKDPDGANLDRIQVIKLWLDSKGKSHEKVYDVVASDNRIAGKDGSFPPLQSTVDISRAHYTNSTGATQLQAFWQDPEFDPQQQAAYYARVLEIPTPRWSTYDAVTLGVRALEPATIQERAVTSAIWYSP